jgi:hypothetical protein
MTTTGKNSKYLNEIWIWNFDDKIPPTKPSYLLSSAHVYLGNYNIMIIND